MGLLQKASSTAVARSTNVNLESSLHRRLTRFNPLSVQIPLKIVLWIEIMEFELLLEADINSLTCCSEREEDDQEKTETSRLYTHSEASSCLSKTSKLTRKGSFLPFPIA